MGESWVIYRVGTQWTPVCAVLVQTSKNDSGYSADAGQGTVGAVHVGAVIRNVGAVQLKCFVLDECKKSAIFS